jgi:16S rRNA pseudouridine516 synthase
MPISRSRLDRCISKSCHINRKDVRLLVAQGRLIVDGEIATGVEQLVDKFTHILLDDETIQANKASYLMLHKPVGVVCATKDEQHKTVLDLLDLVEHPDKDSLHIVGRLDLNTSGLVLLTNDSRWSEKLMSPEHKVEKHYRVTLQNKLTSEYIAAFAKGMYFAFEDLTTRPVKLTIISDYIADVCLTEGRYHQIKRMFGRFQNPVTALHRYAIGTLTLDATLELEQSRELTTTEVHDIFA